MILVEDNAGKRGAAPQQFARGNYDAATSPNPEPRMILKLRSPPPPPLSCDGENGLVLSTMKQRNVSSPSQSSPRLDVESLQHSDSEPSRMEKDKKMTKPMPRQNANSAKGYLGKLVTYALSNPDDETIEREDTELSLIIITLIKEAIVGVIIALALLICAVALFPSLESSRTLKSHAMSRFADETTLPNFEELAGWKLMKTDEHSSNMDELSKLKQKKDKAQALLEGRDQEWHNVELELAHTQGEMDGLKRVLNARKNALLTRKQVPVSQQTPEQQQGAPASASSQEDVLTEYEKEYSKSLQHILDNFDQYYPKGFCKDCQYKPGVKCIDQVWAWNKQYSITRRRAIARIMLEANSCRKTITPTKDKNPTKEMDGYCGECIWGYKKTQTCDAMVEFLISSQHKSRDAAQRIAMEKKACVGKKKKQKSQPQPQPQPNKEEGAEQKQSSSGSGNKQFCGECVWGTKKRSRCDALVDYLMQKFNKPRSVAESEAMLHTACVRW